MSALLLGNTEPLADLLDRNPLLEVSARTFPPAFCISRFLPSRTRSSSVLSERSATLAQQTWSRILFLTWDSLAAPSYQLLEKDFRKEKILSFYIENIVFHAVFQENLCARIQMNCPSPVLLESKTLGILFLCPTRPLADRPFSEKMVHNIQPKPLISSSCSLLSFNSRQ